MMKWTDKDINILLIDNDEDNYILTQHFLTDIDDVIFNLDWAKNYTIGLDTIIQQKHDVYLIDYHLGPDNGLSLLKEAIKNGCRVPLILLTGQEDRNIDLAAMKVGAAGFLAKDQVNASVLERSIRYAIEGKRTEAKLHKVQNQLKQGIETQTSQLKKTNAILKEKFSELEHLKQQIQNSLERRTRQVETGTDIAQKIATTPDPKDLFYRVINLVQARFGYYHVHLYTIENNQLIMQEGTAKAGQQMKNLGHKIPLDAEKSLVAQVAREKEAKLVSDVYQEPNWLPNPLLPETKAEIAVPIKLGNEVLGVLDVQNDTINSLNQEDQILLMGLCGQIAVALNNSRLEARRKRDEEAKSKLIEELDAFAHTVGYNLRDPLDLIIGYANLLKEQARLPEELQDYLNAIARSGRKMSNIIDELELLTGVRRAEVELKPLNMGRIVAEVQQRLTYLINEHSAKVVVSEYWPTALGHQPWVEEVWANYLSHAIKHGGCPPQIQLGATAQSNGMIRFWVRDNGAGLSEAEQTQLITELNHFDQIQVRGYGLGLSIAKRIVTKLGGTVKIDSEGIPGKGTVFAFTLPGQQELEQI